MKKQRGNASPISLAVARNLLAIRTKAGLTQSDLAARAGVTIETVARIERVLRARRSANANPSLETLVALADALGVPVDQLFSSDAPPPTLDETRRLMAILRDASPTIRRRVERVATALVRERK